MYMVVIALMFIACLLTIDKIKSGQQVHNSSVCFPDFVNKTSKLLLVFYTNKSISMYCICQYYLGLKPVPQ